MSGFVGLTGGEALRNPYGLLHEVLQTDNVVIDGHLGPEQSPSREKGDQTGHL